MAHTYDVVDPIGGFIASFVPPYRKFFFTNVNFVPDPMFLMWFKTGYSSNAKAASVRVNGSEIGKLFPRPRLGTNSLTSKRSRSSFHVLHCLGLRSRGQPS